MNSKVWRLPLQPKVTVSVHDPQSIDRLWARIAIDDLSSIIGEVHSEDILGEIFGRFCIGK